MLSRARGGSPIVKGTEKIRLDGTVRDKVEDEVKNRICQSEELTESVSEITMSWLDNWETETTGSS